MTTNIDLAPDNSYVVCCLLAGIASILFPGCLAPFLAGQGIGRHGQTPNKMSCMSSFAKVKKAASSEKKEEVAANKAYTQN